MTQNLTKMKKILTKKKTKKKHENKQNITQK